MVIATVATVIASQALITGAFSLTMQAVQLGYLPRMDIRHTSADEFGQIYVPAINWTLMIACIALVIAFGSSSNLAAAYGVAVTTTMVITTLLLFVIERKKWKWSLAAALAFTAFYLTIDLSFWGANLIKIPEGGWFPLVIGAVVFTLMTTWRQGRRILGQHLQANTIPFSDFVDQIHADRNCASTRYSDLHVQQSAWNTARAAAQSEAQQDTPQQRDSPVRGDREGAACAPLCIVRRFTNWKTVFPG